jgi:hypothetical protein
LCLRPEQYVHEIASSVQFKMEAEPSEVVGKKPHLEIQPMDRKAEQHWKAVEECRTVTGIGFHEMNRKCSRREMAGCRRQKAGGRKQKAEGGLLGQNLMDELDGHGSFAYG